MRRVLLSIFMFIAFMASAINTWAVAVPTGLAATDAIGNHVTLSWDTVTDAVKYNIFQDSSKIGDTTGLTIQVTGLIEGVTYAFQVQSVDIFDNVSALSSAVNVVAGSDGGGGGTPQNVFCVNCTAAASGSATSANQTTQITLATTLNSTVATEATLVLMNAKFVSGTDIGDVTINNAAGGSAVNIQDGGNVISIDDDGGSITIDGTVILAAGVASIGTLGANSGTDIGDVTINNASGASAVNIQDGGNIITVDGIITLGDVAATFKTSGGGADALNTAEKFCFFCDSSFIASGTIKGKAVTIDYITATGTTVINATTDHSALVGVTIQQDTDGGSASLVEIEVDGTPVTSFRMGSSYYVSYGQNFLNLEGTTITVVVTQGGGGTYDGAVTLHTYPE